MKHYQTKEKKENKHILSRFILQMLIVFIIATTSIVLYDMYINIDVDTGSYTAKTISKEVNTENTEDISTMLEEVSESVVRNF